MQTLPRPAQYLLRIDDLSPTVSTERWSAIRELTRQFGLRPLLATIPDNQDEELDSSEPDDRFWVEMHEMEMEGATIALHGYQHQCSNRARSLLPLHRMSEFAGYPLDEQRRRIRAGLDLLRRKGLSPRLFVAPKHSFDRTTLRALREEGLPFLSDGFARIPFTRDGVTWIPQQLWGPAGRSKGLWTICIHPDSMNPRRLAELKRFLGRHSKQFTSFDDVIRRYSANSLSLAERCHEQLAMWRVMIRMKRHRRKS